MIALNPDGVQRHQGEWRVSPLDDPESNLRELTTALAQMTECDGKTPSCKKCQSAQTSQRVWHSVECRARLLPANCAEHEVVSDGNEETSAHWS